MSKPRQQVLQLLQDGKVTAEQAMELLAALGLDEELDTGEEEEVLTGEVVRRGAPPDLSRFRRFWQIPFFISLGILILSGLALRSLYQRSEGVITFAFVCVWSIFMLAVVLTTLALFARRAPWLHLRIREKGGRRIAISLPLPLGLATWGLNLAQGFVGEEKRDRLSMAAAFITAAHQNIGEPGAEPLMIDIDDDDGDQVQIYVG